MVLVVQGVVKKEVLVFEKVQLEAACKTCYLASIIKMQNFVRRKSMVNNGVATAANKKWSLKILP
jgi:hypothetical protein